MKIIRETLFFECKCRICVGEFDDQDEILKTFRDLVKNLDSNHHQKRILDWEREAQIYQEMAELTEKLDIGPVIDIKMNILDGFAAAAHLARNEELLRKAIDSLQKLVVESKMNDVRLANDRVKHDMCKWTSQRKSKKSPKREEIESFLCHFIN